MFYQVSVEIADNHAISSDPGNSKRTINSEN